MNPDPLQLEETAGPIPLEPTSRWPLLVAVLIVILAAVFVAQAATPRTGQGPTSTAPALSGVPQRVAEAATPSAGVTTLGSSGDTLAAPVITSPDVSSSGPGAVLPDTSTAVSGTASWYCGGGSACTRGYPEGTLAAAAGPALRVGDWRGRIVKVCAGGRCVRVSLIDYCQCGGRGGRVIDLYRGAFARLGSPSRGVLRVEVTWGGTAIGLPPTDTR